MLASFSNPGSFFLHIPCWLLFQIRGVSLKHPVLLHFYLGSFSYTSHVDFVFIWGVSLTHPTMTSILSGEFLLHIPCWLHFYLGSFCYTSRAGFNFMREVSLTHPILTVFMWGVSLTHSVLPSLLCGEFF